jgi:asparagine synthase (glutamine-hydrolysing)
LGHRALRLGNAPVIHQPLANEDDGIWITFDGEIYNKASIIQQLEKNHVLKTNSSAEAVVHAYEDDGFKCLNRLNGMFAFCLWDSENSLLFSATDRLGMKPLYYSKQQDLFLLSSEIKGILAHPMVSRTPNKRFIYDYLVKGYPTRTGETFFKGIEEVMPAHYIVIDKKGIEIQEYWEPIQHAEANLRIDDDQWCASHLRQLLKDSIRIRIPSDLPIGTFLSGGLDSTCIAFLVDEILKSNKSEHSMETTFTGCQELFSAIYERPTEQGDEKNFIEEVERALKTKINYITPSVAGKWNDVKQFVSYIEEPVAVFNYYVFWCLYQAAGQKVKVVYSGQGADAILGGQRTHVMTYFGELLKNKEFGKYVKELAASLNWILPYFGYSMVFKRNEESTAKNLLSQGFIAAYDSGKVSKEDSTLQDALVRDVTQHAVEYLRVDDRGSSAFRLECRHPFLDHRVVEFVFLLPPTQKIRNGWTKYVLRNAMKGLIPDLVRKNRRKAGTPIPQQRWMNDLKEDIRRLLESDKFRKREYFNQPAILNVFDRYCSGKLNRIQREYYANLLWRILNLELWLEIFFDQDDTMD